MTANLRPFGLLCVIAMVFGSACGGSDKASTPTSPTPPSMPPPTPQPPSDNWSITGHLVTYANGKPIAGAHVTSADLGAVDTDAQGTFSFSGTTAPSKTSASVSIAASGYVTRDASLTWQRGSRDVSLDLIPLAAPFSMDFYRQLVRNAYEAPAKLEPLRRWTDNPRFYVRTVDDAGIPVEPEVISLVVSTLPRAVQAFTNGRLAVAGIDQGSASRARTNGWINVIFKRDSNSKLCGQSYIGAINGEITLWDDTCSCGSVKVPGDVVLHEVGHAMGFWHVSDRRSVMYPKEGGNCSNGALSPNEQFHSALAYTRAPGNLDPDSEPSNWLFVLPVDDLEPPLVICPAPRR